MEDREKQWFNIVKHNFTTGNSKVVEPVRGISRADQRVEALSRARTQEEKDNGIDFLHEERGKSPARKRVPKLPRKRLARR